MWRHHQSSLKVSSFMYCCYLDFGPSFVFSKERLHRLSTSRWLPLPQPPAGEHSAGVGSRSYCLLLSAWPCGCCSASA